MTEPQSRKSKAAPTTRRARSAPRSQRGARDEGKHDALLDAALRVILERGFYQASSNEIARAAGVSWGAIQYYFSTREQLLVAVLEREFDKFVTSLARLQVAGGPLRERLNSLADFVFDFYARPEYAAVMQIQMNLIRDPMCEEATHRAMARFMGGLEAGWSAAVRQAMGEHADETNKGWFIFFLLRGLAIGETVSQAVTTPVSPRYGPASRLRSLSPRGLAESRELLLDVLVMMAGADFPT